MYTRTNKTRYFGKMDNSKYNTYTFYKHICKDVDVPGIYVGSVNDFNRRETKPTYNFRGDMKLKLYNTVRANGGFYNWNMVVLETCICETEDDASIVHGFWIDKLQPDLNMIVPQAAPTSITF